MEKANTIKFTAKMSETEIMFLGTKLKVYKGIRFNNEPSLEVQTHTQTNRPEARTEAFHVLVATTRRKEMLH